MAGLIEPQVIRIAKALKQVCPCPRYEKDESSRMDFAGWYNEKRSDIHIQGDFVSAAEIKKLRSLLDDLKKTKSLLETAYEDTNTAHTYVTNALNASLPVIGKSILMLPDRNLAFIFEKLKDNLSDLRSISTVCKRFKNILLEHPVLWTTIRSTYSLETCNTFLSKSLNSDLTVHMKLFSVNGSTWVEGDFQKLLSQGGRSRIKELFIEMSQESLIDKDKFTCDHGEFLLPKLLALSITSGDWTGTRDRTEEFLCRLVAPALKSYQGHATGSLTKWIHQLEYCEVTFDSITGDCLELYIKNLVQCQDLRLTINHDAAIPNWKLKESLTLKENLQRLRSLHICLDTYHIGHYQTSVVDYLLTNYIPTEQIQDLTVCLLLAISSTDSDLSHSHIALKRILARNYDKIKVLNIIHAYSSSFKIPLKPSSMLSLEHICIEGHDGERPTHKFSELCEEGAFGKIKTITFKKCLNISAYYLLDMASVLSSEQYSSSFQILSLCDCNISRELWTQLKILIQDKFRCTPSISD